MNSFLDEVPAGLDCITDEGIIETYRRDQAAPGLISAGMPLAVVRPRTTAEVQSVVRAAATSRTPIVPRGAGSGLSGGANAIDGAIVLSLERMNEVTDVDPMSMLAVAQPGVVTAALKAAAAKEHLMYAPDPASHEFSTIGGNVATNAGGLCCVKYGVTRDALLGLEVVLAGGEAIRLGRRTRKGVAGYDLVSLFCGSEGTLGVVTEVTLKLLPEPRAAATLAAVFPDLGCVGRAIEAIVRGATPSLLEVMDATTLAAVEQFQPMGFDEDAAAVLFARSDTGPNASISDVTEMADWCEKAGASFVAVSDEEAEGRMLMAARRLAYPSLERLGATLLDDVAVPVGQIHRLLDAIPAIAAANDVVIGTFGHAGDGNMHPTIVYPARDPDAAQRAREAFTDIVELALSLGGTVTGEHGVGVLKRGMLAKELGDAHALHRLIKRAVDPENLMNPGKGL